MQYSNNRVRRIFTNSSGRFVRTIAGSGTVGDAVQGLANTSTLYTPFSVTVSPSGVVFFSTFDAPRILSINPISGLLSYVAGSAVAGYTGDGGGALLAQIGNEISLKFMANGALVWAERGFHVVRAVLLTQRNATNGTWGFNTTVLRVAGVPATTTPFRDGAADTATFSAPSGLALDDAGGIWIADSG